MHILTIQNTNAALNVSVSDKVENFVKKAGLNFKPRSYLHSNVSAKLRIKFWQHFIAMNDIEDLLYVTHSRFKQNFISHIANLSKTSKNDFCKLF